MDSDDESVAGDSGEEAGSGAAALAAEDGKRGSPRGSKGRRPDARREEIAEEAPAVQDHRPLPARVAEVRTFSDMLRLAPALQSRAPRMPPKELAAVVTAAARVRFYDAEVFQSGLLPTARRHLQRSKVSFGVDEAVDLITGLAELNVYDQPIFSKVVEVFAERKQDLEDPVRRVKLLTAFRAVGHQGDKDFIDYLAQREKAERYEQRLREMQGQSGPQIYYGGLRK